MGQSLYRHIIDLIYFYGFVAEISNCTLCRPKRTKRLMNMGMVEFCIISTNMQTQIQRPNPIHRLSYAYKLSGCSFFIFFIFGLEMDVV